MKRLKVLLIDHDPVSTYISERLFTKLNLSLITISISDLDTAIEYLKETSCDSTAPQFIFVDLNKDITDSLGFLQKISLIFDSSKKMPMIFGMSIYSFKPFEKAAFAELGIVKILSKPLNTDTIEEITKDYIFEYELSVIA